MKTGNTRLTARQQKRAVDLLQEAMNVIGDELFAAGPEDVEDHPTLKAHAKTYGKIQRFLRNF